MDSKKRTFEGEDDTDDLSFLDSMSISDLKALASERNVEYTTINEKGELVSRLKQQLEKDKLEGIPVKRKKIGQRRDCPYLDTITRSLLDFDFEKVCSVTLQNLNVYACLVCGKYFQGKGKNSPAYVHCLQADHHVFINLHNEKVYCLPDDYEVIDPSLADVKYALNPTFTPDVVAKLDKTTKPSMALDGTEYLPGFVGLNNVKLTDFMNSSIQALVHVAALRNFFIYEQNYTHLTKDPLVLRFGELVRKMYNPKNYKAQVSPHELQQAISTISNKKFHIGVRGDPLELILFMLNHMHVALGGTKKSGSSIIHKIFQGHLELSTEIKVTRKDHQLDVNAEAQFTTTQVPFLYLSLDIPPPPLFRDEQERNIIPQVPIFQLLTKYDGKTMTHKIGVGRQKFRILKMPQYLIVHLKRFTRNNFFMEKNPTIVNFPMKSFDMAEYLGLNEPAKYDLVANICHDGEPDKGSYRVHIFNRANDTWYEMQDLTVKAILPQLIVLSESYIQIYERQ